MALKTRAELDAYFNTGDTPTEAQFQDLIDSIPNLLDDVENYGKEINITAFNGGGQANAYELSQHISVVTITVNPGDSIKLPAGNIVRVYHILNYSANAIDLFPPIGGRLNKLAINGQMNMGSGTAWTAFNYDNLLWGLLW